MAITAQLKEVFYSNTIVFYILAASVVELIAAGSNCENAVNIRNAAKARGEFPLPRGCTGENGWAVAVGSISVGLTFIHALVSACKPTLADKWAPFLSTLLFLLWIPGAGVITFRGPFIMSGNGYFSAWVAFFASLLFFQRNGLAMIAGTRGEEASALQPDRGSQV